LSPRPNILVIELGRQGLRRYTKVSKTSKASASTPLADPRVSRLLPFMLLCLLWVLKALRFRVTTLSSATAAPYGRFVCLTIDGIDQGLPRLVRTLEKLRLPATIFVPTHRVGRPGALNWNDLRRLSVAGWEVGSMGHDPVDLSARSYVEQKRLIGRAKSLISARLGAAPLAFAFPYGAYDATTLSCLREEGFTSGVTLRRGLNAGATDGLQLRRLSIAPTSPRDLAGVLSIGFAALSRSPTVTQPVIRPGAEHAEVRSGVHS
jgi:peptidoglycan/xylan/chitin deacetylase (PgdA/CDA1 family)